VTLVTVVSLLLAGFFVVGGASGASATASCGTSVGGADNDVDVKHATANGHAVRLWTGQLFDDSYGQLDGWRSGDQTWIDRRKDGSTPHTTCGPFTRAWTNECRQRAKILARNPRSAAPSGWPGHHCASGTFFWTSAT
jgi:hypothetical protein